MEDPALLRRFHQAGVQASRVATVYEGLRPNEVSILGRRLPIETTRPWIRSQRLLARTPTGLELWSCYTGAEPLRRLEVVDTSVIRVPNSNKHWVELELGSRRVWVARGELGILAK